MMNTNTDVVVRDKGTHAFVSCLTPASVEYVKDFLCIPSHKYVDDNTISLDIHKASRIVDDMAAEQLMIKWE